MVSSITYKEISIANATAIRHSPSVLVREDWSYDIHFSSVRITTLTLASPTEGVAYSAQIDAIGGSESGYEWEVVYGSIPTGLTLGASGTPYTTLSGTPSVSGTFTFTVRVTDDGGNVDDQEYTFTVAAAPPVPDDPVVDMTPLSDSIRGGREVVVHGSNVMLHDESLDTDFRVQTLPAAWTETLTSGGARRSSFEGMTLMTSPLSGSAARVDSVDTYGAFEATFVLTPVAPSQGGASEVTLASFEFAIDGTSYAHVRAFMSDALDADKVHVDSVIGLADATLVDGALSFAKGTELSMRIVRCEGYVWLFVNDEKLAETSRFTTVGEGGFRLSAANGSANTRVVTRVTDFTLRSHAQIGQRLIEDKVDFSRYRVVGNVPEATVDEIGPVDYKVFGPWGVLTYADGFTYERPDGISLGDRRSPLVVYSDESIVRIRTALNDYRKSR